MRRLIVPLIVAFCLAGCGATATAVPTLVLFTPTSTATVVGLAETDTPVPPAASPTASGGVGSVKKAIATAEPTTAPTAVPVATAASAATVALPPTAAPPTAVAQPTATPVPPTAVAAPTDTPVPSSAYAVSPYFDEVATMEWDVPVPYGYTADAGKNTLGVPIDAGTWTQLSRQWFGAYADNVCTGQDSLMVWQADTRQVSYLTQGSGGSSSDCYPDPWYRYQDTYQQGEPNNEGEQAPAGQYVPVLGFGKVWREIQAQAQSHIGFATTQENPTEGMVQRFENGTAYYFVDTASIYVLFDNYRRIGRSGAEFPSLTWFLIQ